MHAIIARLDNQSYVRCTKLRELSNDIRKHVGERTDWRILQLVVTCAMRVNQDEIGDAVDVAHSNKIYV